MVTKNIDTRDSIRVVTSNNIFKMTGLEEIGIQARKLLYLAIAQCRKDDSEFYEFSITARKFAELMDIKPQAVYNTADDITDQLMKGFFKYKEGGKKRFVKFQLFKKCDYTNGVLTFQMSEEMAGIVLNLKKDFSKPLLNDFMKFKSKYSISVWHLMQREMKSQKPKEENDIYYFTLTLAELRFVTGTVDSFIRLSRFKEKVLDKAIEEIAENCGVEIKYTYIKDGRTVVAFNFIATKTKDAKDDIVRIDENRPGLEEAKKRASEGLKRIEENKKRLHGQLNF